VTSGLLGFTEVRHPENDSPPANIRSPELVAGTHAVLRGATRSPGLTTCSGSQNQKNSPPPA
ncbi:MAG: hypothetical protein WAV63_06910, partial [Trichococcus flocculiformis]